LDNEVGATDEVAYREIVDYDGDGIADGIDIDDDNDGITDTDEGLVVDKLEESVTFTLNPALSSTGAEGALVYEDGNGRTVTFQMDNIEGASI